MQRFQDIVPKDGGGYMDKDTNKPCIRVTEAIAKYFPVFDSDIVIKRIMNSNNWKNSKYYGKTPDEIKKEWEDNRDKAANEGTEMHTYIEQFFLGNKLEEHMLTREVQMFLNWWNLYSINYRNFIFIPELLVYNKRLNLAGTIDLVGIDISTGEIILLDWKRSKEIKRENKYEKGKGIFSNYDNCNYVKYSIQLNTYRKLLEELVTLSNPLVVGNSKLEKVTVKEMFIVVFSPEKEKEEVINVNFMDFTLNELVGTFNDDSHFFIC